MLLSNRRQALVYFCLLGMETCWITPPVALLLYVLSLESSALAILSRLLAVLLIWILTLELLNRLEVDSPRYELTVAGLVALTSFLLVRFWLYAERPFWDFGWLRNTLAALFSIHQGLHPELVLILTSLLLWQRATSATSRSLDFFSVGMSFRLGILLLVLGAALLSYCTGNDVTYLLWIYLALGLTAVALARTNEKAADAPSAGRLLPLPRLAQLLVAIAVTVGGAAGLSVLYTPERVKMALGSLQPLWARLGVLWDPLGRAFLWLLKVLLVLLEWLLKRVVAAVDWAAFGPFVERLSQLVAATGTETDATLSLPPQISTALRYGGVLLALLVAIGFVVLYLDKIRSSSRRHESEEEKSADITLGGATVDRGMRWLRDRIALARRFGLSRHLLAAVSVQNMYANVCRLARQRGYPRHPAQPPDDYLPILGQAFAGQQGPLARITAAYMQVHYGDRPVTGSEVRQLRMDYEQVRTAAKEQP